MKTGFHPLFCAPMPTTLAHPLTCQNQSYLAITFNKLLMLSSIQLKTTFIVVMPNYFTRYYYHYHYHTCLNVLSVHLSFFPFYLEPASKTGNHRISHCPDPASTPGYYRFKLILQVYHPHKFLYHVPLKFVYFLIVVVLFYFYFI